MTTLSSFNNSIFDPTPSQCHINQWVDWGEYISEEAEDLKNMSFGGFSKVDEM